MGEAGQANCADHILMPGLQSNDVKPVQAFLSHAQSSRIETFFS